MSEQDESASKGGVTPKRESKMSSFSKKVENIYA